MVWLLARRPRLVWGTPHTPAPVLRNMHFTHRTAFDQCTHFDSCEINHLPKPGAVETKLWCKIFPTTFPALHHIELTIPCQGHGYDVGLTLNANPGWGAARHLLARVFDVKACFCKGADLLCG